MKAFIYHACSTLLLLHGLAACRQETGSLPRQPAPPGKPVPVSESVYYEKALVLADSALFDSANHCLEKAAVQYEAKKNWPAYLGCLHAISANLQQKGELAPAREYLDRALRAGVAHLGDTSAAVAQTHTHLGELLITQGQYAAADSLLRLGLRYSQKRFGRNHPATAQSVRALGQLHYVRGEYKEALANVTQSLEVYRQLFGEVHKEVAVCYKIMGNIYYQQQKIEDAHRVYNKSLAITTQSRGQNHPERGKLYANLGMVYYVLESSSTALTYYRRALKIYQGVSGEKSVPIANVYNNIGNIYEDAGDYERAISYYTNASSIFLEEFGNDYPLLSIIYGNIGVCFHNLGEIDRSIESYQKALTIVDEEAEPIGAASIYNNLGRAFGIKRDFGKALAYCNRALELYLSDRTDEEGFQLGLASCYSTIAEIYTTQKDFGRVISYYKKAVNAYAQIAGRDHPHIAEMHMQIGNVWLEKNHADSAHFYYDCALEALLPRYKSGSLPHPADLQGVPAKSQLSGVLAAKAGAYKKKYDENALDINPLKLSLDYFELATQVIDLLRHTYKGEEAKLFLSTRNDLIYQQGLETAAMLYQQTGNPTYMNKAFAFSEENKARVLLEVTKQIGAEYTVGIPDSVSAKESSSRSAIALYEKQMADARRDSLTNGPGIQQLQAKIAESKRNYSEFIERIEEAHPDYYRLKYSNTIASMQEVQKQLLPDQALVEYTLTDSLVYIFSITPAHCALSMVKNDSLAQRAQLLRVALKTEDKRAYAKEANALYTILVAPIKKQLKETKKLTIIPDGELSYVPFEILLKEKPESNSVAYANFTYLLKDYQMSYNYSATLLLENKSKPHLKAPEQFLGLAPSFKKATSPNDSTADFLPLPGARAEVVKIADKFDGDYYLDAAATKAQFKKMAPQYNMILMATHALIDDEHPNLSKLVFSYDQSQEDRFLYAYELYNLKLRAELVTLSACNTGVGKLQRGEGVISLARGFAYAGCPTLLVSLWPASDKPTSRIMQYFYEGLKKGLAKDDALYHAKLEYLDSVDEYQANPALWGSFVLVGNVEPISPTGLATVWLLFIGAGVGGLLLLVAGLPRLKRYANR